MHPEAKKALQALDLYSFAQPEHTTNLYTQTGRIWGGSPQMWIESSLAVLVMRMRNVIK